MIIGCYYHPIRERQHSFRLLVVNILFTCKNTRSWIDARQMPLDHVNLIALLFRILVICSNHTVEIRHFEHIWIDEIDLMKPHMDEMFCDNRSQATNTNDGDGLVTHNCSHHI